MYVYIYNAELSVNEPRYLISFYEALVILFQRIEPKYINDFIHKLSNVIHKLEALIHFNVVISRLKFERVELGLKNFMKLVAQPDFIFMRQMLTDCHMGYTLSYENLAETIMTLMDEVSFKLPMLLNKSLITDSDVSITGSMKLLIDALESVLSGHLFIGSSSLKNAPSRLVRTKLHWEGCQHLLKDVKMLLKQSSVWRNETPIHDDTYSDLNETYHSNNLHTCMGELGMTFKSLKYRFNDFDRDIERFDDSTNFYDTEYLESEKLYLENLRVTKSGLSDKLELYSQNQTTQIVLAKEITDSMLSDVEQILDRIMAVVEKNVLKPLVLAASSIDTVAKRWYVEYLRAMRILAPYYNDNGIEGKIRALKIWRHPLARLATSDILQFKYQTSESWHTWDTSVNLQEFVQSGNATMVIWNIMEDYFHILSNELIGLKLDHKNAEHELLGAFTGLIDHFSQIQSESLIDESFVL